MNFVFLKLILVEGKKEANNSLSGPLTILDFDCLSKLRKHI